MTTPLLAAHLRKMRSADSIVIHHMPRLGTTVTCNTDGQTTPTGDTFYVGEARVTTYNDVDNSRPGGRLPIHKGVHDACWVLRPSEIASVLAVARPGDHLTPLFFANNNNSHVAAANLTVDELHIELVRWTPSGRKKIMSFMVATYIGPADSAGRNIRYIPAN